MMARFFDGTRATAHEVAPRLSASCLAIATRDGPVLATWPLARIVVRDGPEPDGTLTLSCGEDPARRRMNDPGLLAALAAGVRLQHRTSNRPVVTVVITSAVILIAGVWLLQGLPRLAAAILPAALEDRLAACSEGAVARGHPRCTGPAGQQALDRLVVRLRAAGRISQPVSIAVPDAPPINAVTLPRGRVLVMRGLIDHVDDGTELASVIAHELGHVAHRDPTVLLLRRMSLGMLAAALGWNDALGSADGLAQSLVASSYSRSAEAAADAAGEHCLAAAGLRADGLGRFFARMEEREEGGDSIPWLATHPPTEQRRALATRTTTGQPPFSEAEWQALCAMRR